MTSNIGQSVDSTQGAPAPIWHTCLLIALLCAPIAIRIQDKGHESKHASNSLLYVAAIGYQVLLVLVASGGYYINGRRVKDLIGKTWSSSREALRSLSIGVFVGAVSIALTLTIESFFGSLYTPAGKLSDLLPRGILETSLFLLFTISAAFAEEIIFRGYFLQQVYAWNGSAARAIIIQAAAFSASHGLHQTGAGVVDKIAFGLLLGVLSKRERSLIPGMIAHSAGNIAFVILGMALA